MSGAIGAFVSQYLRAPTQIGAIAPSSKALGRAMLDGVDLAHANAVVEFGPGTGPFTDLIVERVGKGTMFFAMELNPKMAAIFRKRHPGVKLHQRSVAEVAAACREEGIGDEGVVDAVICGLPWASFGQGLQRELLAATVKVLKPGGVFRTFAYHTGLWLPTGKRFARLLPEYFGEVERSGSVWGNVPPAFVYRCTKRN